MHPTMTAPLASEERPLKPAMLRGWRCRCPNCGEGKILKGFLKVNDRCPICGTELFHHRADDGPAYITILIVGHILAPVMLFIFANWDPNPILTAILLSLGCIGLSLYLLPRIKGAFVALQWAKRMHGFADKA